MLTFLTTDGKYGLVLSAVYAEWVFLVLWIYSSAVIRLYESCHPGATLSLFLYHVLFNALSSMGQWLWLGAFLEVTTWKQALLPSPLHPTPLFTLLPWSHNPSHDKVRSQWEVWTLTSQKTLETESRGAELLRLLTLVGWTPCLLGCEKLLEGLKDALSCLGRLAGCCLLNSITSHFKSQLLLNVLYQHAL